MADRPPDTTIYQRYAECYYGFETLCDAFQKSMVSHGMENFDVETEFDRYKLWAGSVGAMHAGKTEKLSLDYRLREASFFREQVVRLLGILRQHIDSADEILRGKRRPVEECFLESASDEDSSLGASFDLDAHGGDDSPWDISDSELAQASSEHREPDGNSETPESGMTEHSQSEGQPQWTV
ncbi:hypothetical protein SLS54_007324 [Diplodia seriata]